MRVIREAHNKEKKRSRQHRRRKLRRLPRKHRAKALIADIKRGRMRKEEIKRRLEGIFGEGCSQEIKSASSNEKSLKESRRCQ